MREVDVSTWKAFRVGDWFDVSYGKFIPKSKSVDYGVPHITTSAENNGFGYMVDKALYPAGCITIASDGSMGATFYQAEPYSAGNIVSSLVPLKMVPMNEYIGLFIATALKQESYKYSWGGFKFSVNRVRETLLPLPATPAGTPDWDYMENYMKAVMEREEMFAEHLASLTAEAVADGHPIDVSDWGEFRVGDLFDIRPTKSLGKTNQYLFDDNGQVPVVVNSAQNNGIGGYTMYTATENGGIITFSDTTDANSIFYQHEPFVGYSHVQGMYPKCGKWSETSMLFFVGVFKACALDMGFSYANKFRRDLAANLIVKLPITPAGTPDWAYMEQFMQQQMDKSQQLVEHLDQLI